MTLERLFNENFASKIICLNAGNQLLGYFLPSTDMLPITSLRSGWQHTGHLSLHSADIIVAHIDPLLQHPSNKEKIVGKAIEVFHRCLQGCCPLTDSNKATLGATAYCAAHMGLCRRAIRSGKHETAEGWHHG